MTAWHAVFNPPSVVRVFVLLFSNSVLCFEALNLAVHFFQKLMSLQFADMQVLKCIDAESLLDWADEIPEILAWRNADLVDINRKAVQNSAQ